MVFYVCGKITGEVCCQFHVPVLSFYFDCETDLFLRNQKLLCFITVSLAGLFLVGGPV